MVSWPIDHAATVYFLLGVAALALAALWWMNRKRYYLIALGVVAGLAVLVILLSLVVVTDRQRIRTAIVAMRDGVVAGNPDAVFPHFSKGFQLDFQDPRDFIDRAGRAIRRNRVRDIVLWDFDFEVSPDREAKAVVAFRARVVGEGGEGWFLVRTDFVFEDNAWRMKTIRLFNAIANTDQAIPIPTP